MRTSLIVEDDVDASDILASLVRLHEIETVQAYTGEEGLKFARESEPDIIFLDLMLPDLDGYQICELLKLDPETNGIPVVMVTALSAEENRVKGFRVGADVYVSKPYTREEIDRAIEEAIEHRVRLEGDQVAHYVKFDLSSEVESLKSVNELFGIILRSTKLRDQEIVQLRTALQEMGQNAIEWGNKYDTSKRVKITVHVASDRIEICVADEGEGFDPENIPHAATGDDDPIRHFTVRDLLGLREGGFGILIARGLVDEVKYNDSGNEVTLIKRLQ